MFLHIINIITSLQIIKGSIDYQTRILTGVFIITAYRY